MYHRLHSEHSYEKAGVGQTRRAKGGGEFLAADLFQPFRDKSDWAEYNIMLA